MFNLGADWRVHQDGRALSSRTNFQLSCLFVTNNARELKFILLISRVYLGSGHYDPAPPKSISYVALPCMTYPPPLHTHLNLPCFTSPVNVVCGLVIRVQSEDVDHSSIKLQIGSWDSGRMSYEVGDGNGTGTMVMYQV